MGAGAEPEERAAGADRSFSVAIANCGTALADANARIRAHLERAGVDEAAVHAVDLVLEELVGNVLRYGFPDGREHVIRVAADVRPASVVVRIDDDGQPFDPTAHPEPAPAKSLAEAVVGGQGIAMVRRATRAMRYRREAGRNRLEVEIARCAPRA
jgi:anti-sigma regulatory factor (Ser/Thr protein kinase)